MACPLCKLSFGGKTGAQACKPLTTVNKFVARMFNNMPVVCPNNPHPSGTLSTGQSGESSSGPASKRQRVGEGPLSTAIAGIEEGGASSVNRAEESPVGNAPQERHKDKRKRSGGGGAGSSAMVDRDNMIDDGRAVGSLNTDAEDLDARCDWSGSYGDFLSKHLAMCPAQLVSCSAGCGADVLRCRLEAHKLVCPEILGVCEICNARFQPSEKSQHMNDYAQLHVRLLAEKLRVFERAERDRAGVIGAGGSEIKKVAWDVDIRDLASAFPSTQNSGTNKDAHASFLTPQVALVGVSGFRLIFFPAGTPSGKTAVPPSCSLFLEGPTGYTVSFKLTVSLFDHSGALLGEVTKEQDAWTFFGSDACDRGWHTTLFPVAKVKAASRCRLTVSIRDIRPTFREVLRE